MTHNALLIGVPGGGVNTSLAVTRLRPVLKRLGFESIKTCSGRQATRAGIMLALEQLRARCGPGDAAFVHYFGHGGRVQFTDLRPEQVFGYITTQAARRAGFEALLDVELSLYFSALARECANVTVMLDCCYSGELVRGGVAQSPRREGSSLSGFRRQAAPAWARAALEREDSGLALDSHPGIIRVCGSSPRRQAFAAVRGGRHIGYMTEAFIAALAEVGDDWPSLYWAALGHRLREHVIDALEMEGQWIALAGPTERRLFASATVDAPGSVAMVPGDVPGSAWLRAGWHQGVSIGDRWALLDPCTPAGTSRPRPLVEMLVTKVIRNRAEVCFNPAALGGFELRAGLPATPLALADPIRVAWHDPPAGAHTAVSASPWLTLAEPTPPHGATLELRGTCAKLPGLPTLRPLKLAELVELLEDRARLMILERSWAAHVPSDCPLRVSWSRAASPTLPLAQRGARLQSGERICIELSLSPTSEDARNSWFVSVLLVEPHGALRLLSTRMPEGIELVPGERERLGWRVGRARLQGIELRWPSALDLTCEHASAKLLFLASRRPIELAHLARPQPRDRDAALALQGLDDVTMRGYRPESSRGCTWGEIPFVLVAPSPPKTMDQ